MSIIGPLYRGDCSISEVPGSRLTQRRGQADELVRTFSGDASLVQDFIYDNPIIGQNGGNSPVFDYQYYYMVLQNLDVHYDGPVANCTLTFYGVRADYGVVATNLLTQGTWHPRSTYLYTDNPADGEWAVNYYAPTINYRYVTNQIIDTPYYQGMSRNPTTITVCDSQQTKGPNGAAPMPGYTRQGMFVWQPFSVCTGFDYDQKGTCFNYREAWVVLIQKPGTVNQGAVSLDMTGKTPAVAPPDADS